MKIEDQIVMVCNECGEHFKVIDPNRILKCPQCKMAGSKFTPFNDYIKESIKWY